VVTTIRIDKRLRQTQLRAAFAAPRRFRAGNSRRLGLAALTGYVLYVLYVAMLSAGCAPKPFNVRSRPVSPPGVFSSRAAAGAIELQAGSIRDQDVLYDTFDANLIMAGLLPVKVSFTNRGSVPVDLKPIRFSLVETGGHKRSPIQPGRAFRRLMRYYKIQAYNIAGYKASRGDFISYGFEADRVLPPGESRWGVLFFENPDRLQGSTLVLSVTGIGAGEVRLTLQ